MTEISMALFELLRKHGLDNDVDFLREGIRLLSQRVMELEVSEQVGAGPYERSDNRQTRRNGYRDRVWETRVGEIPLRIPKVRTKTLNEELRDTFCRWYPEISRTTEHLPLAV